MYGEGRPVGIHEVQQAISRTLVPGVRNLAVREEAGRFIVYGEADDRAHSDNVFRLLVDKLGDSSVLVNGIEVSREVS